MYKRLLISPLLILALIRYAPAQTPVLDLPITTECHQQPLGRVLEIISTTGGFYFSYSGTLFNKDSLVTLPRQTRTIRQLLDQLFHGHLHYLEDGRYIILLPAPGKTQAPPPDQHAVINGTILDQRTGERLDNVSVYAPAELSATMSKKDGSFTVHVKNKGWPILLAVSKEAYIDTIIQIQPGSSHDLTISIYPAAFQPKALLLSSQPLWSDDSIHIEWQKDTIDPAGKELVPGVEATGFGRFLLSSRLRMQSLNLNKIFVTRPVQLSLVPGLSTNGPLNSQVTNKFSVNIVGSYSAGLKGAELAGVFNIDKKNVTGFQAAGVLNIVGGSVHGVQAAGVANKDLDSVVGIQAAAVANSAKHIKGLQLADIYNYADDVHGMQWSAFINRTHHLHGFQLGLINIADTCDGASYGLINIVKYGGLHELSLYADELSPLNVAFRSGTRRAYGIVYAGANPGDQRRSYYFGVGYGIQSPISSKLAIRTEFSYAEFSPLTLRHFANGNTLLRFNLDLHWQPAKSLGVSFGPSMNAFDPGTVYYIGGEPWSPLPKGYSTRRMGEGRFIGWIGWHVAVNIF